MPERLLPPYVCQGVPPKQQTIRILGQNGFPAKATLPPLCVQFPKANRSNRFEERESGCSRQIDFASVSHDFVRIGNQMRACLDLAAREMRLIAG
jgi:hypothetical protein